MGTINYGGSTNIFAYKYPLRSKDFNKLLRDGTKAGIYSGGRLYKISDTQVGILPYKAYFKATGVDGDNKLVRIETTSNVEAPEIVVSPTNPLILGTFEFVEATQNYADYATRAVGDSPVLNEVIFGKALFSGSTLIGFEYSDKTFGLFDEFGNTYVNNLVIENNIIDISTSYVLNQGITDNSSNADGSYEVKRLDDETQTNRTVASFNVTNNSATLTGPAHGLVAGDSININNSVLGQNDGAYLISSVSTSTIFFDSTVYQVQATTVDGVATVGKYVNAKMTWDESALKWTMGYAGSQSNILTDETTWATNYSLDWLKEDSEPTEFYNQQGVKTDIDFGFMEGFDTTTEQRYYQLDTVLVPADRTEEIEYTGTWSDSDSAVYKFGRVKNSSTAGDTAICKFSGVSFAIAIDMTTSNRARFTMEISSDNGANWEDISPIVSETTTDTLRDALMEYKKKLKYGDYLVKLTILEGGGTLIISNFQYTTYFSSMCSVNQYNTGRIVAESPPRTSVLTGTWGGKNVLSDSYWNTVFSQTETPGDTVEFKFYGSKIWTNVFWSSNINIDITVLIDGVSTYNINGSNAFNTDTGAIAAGIGSNIRLDNGTLPEGIHTVKLTAGSNPGSQFFKTMGFSYYSADPASTNTMVRPHITGKDSYAVGIDNPNFSFTGAGWAAAQDIPEAFLRRYKQTTADGDYAEYTLPNNVNLKAVYGIFNIGTNRGEVKITLDPSGTPTVRYINNKVSYSQGTFIDLLLESSLDSVTLTNKVIRIEKNGDSIMPLEGLIFEIDDPATGTCDLNSLSGMPKWSRYNNSQNYLCAVSNSYRMEITGTKTDKSQGRSPIVHGGWVYGGTVDNVYIRTGFRCKKVWQYANTFPLDDDSKIGPISTSVFSKINPSAQNDLGLLLAASSDNTLTWRKIVAEPDTVV